MKTTDGYEIEINQYYYLENGQEVILNSCAEAEVGGKNAFLVTPYYTGKTMQGSVDGGYHYEHKGLETLVYYIFKKPPVEKLSDQYKTELNKIESISITYGELKKKIMDFELSFLKYKTRLNDTKELYEQETKKLGELENQIRDVGETLKRKKQKLSETEDAVSFLKSPDDTVCVDKKELQRLNKIDFKMVCLEVGGVDNWEWYSESLSDFHKRYPED